MEIAERVAVSLPRTLIKRIEKVRGQMQINRSKFFLLALLKYLDNVVEDEDKKLKKIYSEIAETDKELLQNFGGSFNDLPPYE